jgi:alpha-N-arabinofuranosidase
MRRREFLGVAGGLLAARSARAAEGHIEVFIEEPIATISPDLHGHFTEHIGGVIYDGIWVGEGSKIPNIGGIRTALVEAMRRIKPPVVRWPGGCFADSYDWRDGIGPRAQRPRRANFWINDRFMVKAPDGPQKYEPNWFGTNDFLRFCRLTGAQPYLAANLRSLPPKDFYQWVEYCNAPAGLSSLADLRAAQGDRDPYGVRFWGVGNESWGCGGEFAPDEYAVEYRRYTAWVPEFGVKLALIGSGPDGGNLDWTRRFFAKLTEKGKGALGSMYGWALHYYCGTSGAGQAIDFTVDDWYSLLGKATRMESLITEHWSAMGEIDSEHRVKLVVDEWGAWHRAGTEVHPAYLFGQTPTMRDALISALTLDTFHRHADKVAMSNAAQLINNLHCLFLAREDQFIVTPNYHVFAMYAAHQGAQALRTLFAGPAHSGREKDARWNVAGLWGSASLQGKTLVLTAVNTDAAQPLDTEIVLRGAVARSATVTTLAHPDIHAHNSFAAPDTVAVRTAAIEARGSAFTYRFPPASVTKLTVELGS